MLKKVICLLILLLTILQMQIGWYLYNNLKLVASTPVGSKLELCKPCKYDHWY